MIQFFNNPTTLKASEGKRGAGPRLKLQLENKKGSRWFYRPSGIYTPGSVHVDTLLLLLHIPARWLLPAGGTEESGLFAMTDENSKCVSFSLLTLLGRLDFEEIFCPRVCNFQPRVELAEEKKNKLFREEPTRGRATFTSRHIYCTWTR